MTEDEIKAFVGSGLQALMVREHKRRLAECFEQFMTAKPEDLLLVQAGAKAARASLIDISVTTQDLDQLSTETVDLMEEQRKAAQTGLDRHIRERRQEMSGF